MVSSSVSTVFQLAGWYYIPDLVTQNLLKVLHNLSSRLGRPPPAPQTPRYYKHYRYTYAFTVLGYLLYTLIDSARSLDANFYELLGVSPDVDEGGLKIAFRSFAKKFHPDKVAKDGTEGGQEFFIVVRDAYEALKNPVVRFAYDRFGPAVLVWTQCKTKREFISQGLINFAVYYGASLIGLLFWSSIGDSTTSFWRYLIFASLFAAELSFLLSPTPMTFDSSSLLSFRISSMASDFTPRGDFFSPKSTSSLLQTFFPSRVVYQHVQFLRQLFVVLSVALARVVPQLFPPEPTGNAKTAEKMRVLAAAADREASVMLHTDLHSLAPFFNKPGAPSDRVTFSTIRPHPPPTGSRRYNLLFKEIENVLLERNLRQDVGPLKSAWESALARRREGGQENGVVGVESDAEDVRPSDQLNRRSTGRRSRRLSF